MIDLSRKYFLMIEPDKEGESTSPINDELTKRVQYIYKRTTIAPRRLGFYFMGYHRTEHGVSSDDQHHYLPNGVITNSLCVHYVQCYRRFIPESEIRKINKYYNWLMKNKKAKYIFVKSDRYKKRLKEQKARDKKNKERERIATLEAKKAHKQFLKNFKEFKRRNNIFASVSYVARIMELRRWPGRPVERLEKIANETIEQHGIDKKAVLMFMETLAHPSQLKIEFIAHLARPKS